MEKLEEKVQLKKDICIDYAKCLKQYGEKRICLDDHPEGKRCDCRVRDRKETYDVTCSSRW